MHEEADFAGQQMQAPNLMGFTQNPGCRTSRPGATPETTEEKPRGSTASIRHSLPFPHKLGADQDINAVPAFSAGAERGWG